MKINNPNITAELVIKHIGPISSIVVGEILKKYGWNEYLMYPWIRKQSKGILNQIMDDIKKLN
jgi:hypothetical protein